MCPEPHASGKIDYTFTCVCRSSVRSLQRLSPQPRTKSSTFTWITCHFPTTYHISGRHSTPIAHWGPWCSTRARQRRRGSCSSCCPAPSWACWPERRSGCAGPAGPTSDTSTRRTSCLLPLCRALPYQNNNLRIHDVMEM